MLNAEFQREARRDKEHYWDERCVKLEEACKQGHTREFFAHVKQALAIFAPRKEATIKGRNGKILQNGNQIKCSGKSTQRNYMQAIDQVTQLVS